MKTLGKIIAGAAILGVLAGGMYLNDKGTVSDRNNLTYQGYHPDRQDGFDLLIFDDAPLTYRTTDPDLRAIGDSDRFEIGTDYDVRVKTPRWFGLKTVEPIKQSE